ncbi:MAG: RIP metalloprotease RseP [Gammaproteobacteria bacterium]
MTLVITLIAAIVAIGVLVTVHEYGHYIVARKMGIKVLRFSVGFGKPIWRKVAGADQTEYVISSLPLGGYVKMLDEREGPVDPADDGRAFTQKSVWARMAVLVAGPAANFLFAIATFWIIFTVGVPDSRSVIGAVDADSDADRAGLEAGDEIRQINGSDVANWGEARVALLEAVIDGASVDLLVAGEDQRSRALELNVSGNRNTLTEPGNLMRGLGFAPWRPALPAVVGNVSPGGPAALAGLQAGDEIRTLNSVSIDSWDDLVRELKARPGETVQLEVQRGIRPRSFEVALGVVDVQGAQQGRLGVELSQPDDYQALWGDMIIQRTYGPLPAAAKAVGETVDSSVLMLKMFYQMLIGNVSVKNISGPISIAQYAGITAQDGPVYYLRFLALLSLSLGVLNLLPIPMLDGGQIVYQFAEAIKGSPVSMRTEIIGQQIGMVMLLLLMGFAVFQDIGRFAGS